MCGISTIANRAVAQYAVQILSYDQGSTPAIDFDSMLPDNLSASALGSPQRINGGMYPAIVSPFDPPFLRDDIVSIGEGGRLTLRLSNYAIQQAGGYELGIFSNPGLGDLDYPNGQAGSPATTLGSAATESAVVELSGDGVSWASLNGGNPIRFDTPSNGFTDVTKPFAATPGSVPSDFQQPFAGSLSSFNGLMYYNPGGGDMLSLLAGSGGGQWLNISDAGLSQVGYIRFSVADDGTSARHYFNLDAVSISHAALGAATVPEPVALLLVVQAPLILTAVRRRFRATRNWDDRRKLEPNEDDKRHDDCITRRL
jgi:hypothetical protein